MLAKGFSVPDLQHPALPDGFSWFPLPPGWIALGSVLVFALLLFLFIRFARWRRNLWRRQARKSVEHEHTADGWMETIKRILLVQSSRQDIRQLTRAEELLARVPLDETVRSALARQYCQPDNTLAPQLNSRLQQQMRRWLEALPDV